VSDVVELRDGLRVAVRDATPDDEAVIMRAWLVGCRKGGDWPRRVPEAKYYREHKRTVMGLLARSRTLVACNPDRPGQVLGFICYADWVLHWIYVKQMFRRNGIAGHLRGRAMLPHRCSHWTRTAAALPWALRYDPFLLEDR
jgi:hypothetical protein